MSVVAIVLAAGSSQRLGRPKQNVTLAGETLLERTVRISRDAGLLPIIVVARPGADYSQISSIPDLMIAENQDAEEGIASSIRCGISLALELSAVGAVILTCDQPALRSAHLRALIEEQHRLSASAYDGRAGVPAYFPVELFPSLLQLRGDTGARSLLTSAHPIQAEELKLDIDTEHDLEVARSLFE